MIRHALLGGVAGLLAGGVLTFVLGLAMAEAFDISQAEGAFAMGLAFFWVPLGAVAGMVVGAAWAMRRRR